jgi:thiosulfate reductase cytochrome b subunit
MSRKRPRVSGLMLVMFFVLGASSLNAESRPNPMHPTFHLLDAHGKMIREGGKDPDQAQTCGQCHSTAFIAGHNLPAHQQVACLSCHFEGGKVEWSAAAFEADGMLKRQWLRIFKPAVANCGSCHGLTSGPEGPVAIPEDYRAASYPRGSLEKERYQLSRTGGSIFSPQDVQASLLNLADKSQLHFPWDVHARKLVQCSDCHYAPNNPQRLGGKAGTTALLRGEPRRETVSEYLQQPDHHLASANCQTCHDSRKGHDFLPYPARHFEAVSCEACHIPRQLGPAERMVDATLLDASGSPQVEYRGIGGGPANLNTVYTHGSVSPLLPLPVSEKPGAAVRLTPVNLVSRWYWTSGDSKEPISRETLQQALMKNGQYRREVLAALDTNYDGKLDRRELRLDRDSKLNTVKELLMAAGVKNPTIRADVKIHKISHGVTEPGQAVSDCGVCHGPDSRIKGSVLLASWTPGGLPPTWKDRGTISGRIAAEAKGAVVWKPASGGQQNFHVFGLTAKDWPDKLGLLMLIGVVMMVSVHGGYRLVSRRRHPQHAAETRREYLFSAYERIWHWLMAISVLALIITGLQIHFPGRVRLLGAANAVSTHNFFAVVLALNAFLALFYHLTTAAIRQFLPDRQGVAEAVMLQTKYYVRDIFKGLPAPFPRSADHKLNVLQQITYLLLLNVLFPFQIITGAMIWLVGTSPAFAAALGGLSLVAPLHNLGSWMFISFLVAHIYLATTGHKVMAHVRGMMEGYEEVEVGAHAEGERV